MEDRADVALVDAHAERVRRENQRVLALLECALLRLAFVRRQIAVVDERLMPAPLQHRLGSREVADQREVEDRRSAGAFEHGFCAREFVFVAVALAHRHEQVLALDAGVE